MKELAIPLALFVLAACSIYLMVWDEPTPHAHAEKPVFADTVRFIQYLDENTALEEVRNGNLDIYYSRIPADRLEGAGGRDGLRVYDSTGGSYSILVNPAESDEFNPFASKKVRFALNYLVDRKLIVNELMGGFGSPTPSYYGPNDPEYLHILGEIEAFNFRYNPGLAEEMITGAMTERGATKTGGLWTFEGSPVSITAFIRSDDPVRKSIGEMLSSKLQNMGFTVNKEFGDLNKAFVVVYGSDPANMEWSIYTEGWAGSAFARYDSVGLGQMYAPWFSSMPGFNDPSYWNYENAELDEITQKIYSGEFASREERTELVRDAAVLGIEESVRIFLASKTDQYVSNDGVQGVVNDFGAGVPSRFTPINSREADGELAIGVKQIYQGAWNPVMGFSDAYSNQIWGIIADPAVFKHPFKGETLPVRASWDVDTAGPDNTITLPEGAVMWDVTSQSWQPVPDGAAATSAVTFDFEFGNWHHGKMMDINDVLYSLYFTIEWGTQTDDDRTFDTEFTSRAAQTIDTLIGVRVVDKDTVTVYVDYWHFDEGEIAEWASLWSTVPWEMHAAMEQAVMDGKVSFSRSGATSKNVNWLSLLVPNDAHMLREYLEGFREEGHIPAAIRDAGDAGYVTGRYDATIDWIAGNDHAVISNGPFYLESYSPESRTITVSAFVDKTYPFGAGHWSEFEEAVQPRILRADIPTVVQRGGEIDVSVVADGTNTVLYFLTSNGKTAASGSAEMAGGTARITIPGSVTGMLESGAGEIKVFATSDDVLRPDSHSAGFLLVDGPARLPLAEHDPSSSAGDAGIEWAWLAVPIGMAAMGLAIKRWRSSSKAVLPQN